MLVSTFDNKKHNCEFGEQSIAYLYGELSEPQTAEFSLHLKNCSSCADEFNAFSSIHASIRDWKLAKFDVLSTPVIEIPEELSRKSEIAVSDSWLANLRERFSLRFGWVQAGAFAAFLICLSFGFYFLASSGNKEAVSNESDNQIINTVEPNLSNQTSEIARSVSDESNEDVFIEPKTETSDALPTSDRANKKILDTKSSVSTKISKNLKKVQIIKGKSQNAPLSRKNKNPEIYANVTPSNNRNLPKLNNLPEEAEDDDLRLADLFDEIDAG